ncbi:MAG: cyclic nucleotide-binding domain-containing protein [Pseudobdellovibrionaceae bacterium]
MSAPGRVVKKGEYLFKEGDKILNIQLVQTGAVSLCIQRPKKNIELLTVGASQVLGEQGLYGAGTYSFSAIATAETKLMEIPLDAYKQSVETSPQMIKVLVKSLVDRVKGLTSDVKSSRMEKDTSPCPEDQIAKIFGVVFHTANHKGTKDAKDPNKVMVEWPMYKQYSQRVFTESPKRLEQALCVLVKLKLASFEMGRPPEDPEGPEQIMRVNLHDLSAVEAFFEFYQYYYFKGGAKSEVLKLDESCSNLLSNLLTVSEGLEADRFGVVTLDFQKTLDRFKQEFGVNLISDHFSRLEQKGIFAKRQARQDGTVVLQFDLKEFKTTQKIWRILKEIDKWNEKGFVDMTEEDQKPKKKSDGPACPQCQASLQPQSKFCSECGHKIAA